MWTRLDDALQDHPKVFRAGASLGPDGPAIALGVYTALLMWSNRYLTDGALPIDVVRRLPHVRKPMAVAAALVAAGLWEPDIDGFRIHDFHVFNWSAAKVRQHRLADLLRKQNGKQNGRRRHGKKR